MFMQRLIASLILIPLVLVTLFYAPKWVLIMVVLGILLLAGQECWQLIPLENQALKLGFVAALLIALWICNQLFISWLILGLTLWLFIFIAISTYPKSMNYWGRPWIVASLLLLLLPLFVQSMINTYFLTNGKTMILYLFCLVWAADIGAYLAGKRWGKHKLIPQVSPGKSWEGVFGGTILVLIVMLVGAVLLHPNSLVAWVILALLVNGISIFGDLFISMLKRRCNVKDTGALIPGHGGILDRLDSSIAAMPFFYLGVSYWTHAA